MNITELARKIGLPTKELRVILPEIGFDIGQKAIKIDDNLANKIAEEFKKSDVRKKYLGEEEKVEEKVIIKGQEKEIEKKITIGDKILVKELAQKLNTEPTKLILELMKNGIMASLNESVDFDTACIIGEDFGYEVTKMDGNSNIAEKSKERKIEEALEDKKENLKPRPPVVVVMGHVDHGKTKLLDAIRQTNIIDTESGGITQHIGAYQVTKKNQVLSFIDTPGHEAFSTMRSRGAKVADIAILVVAADDGVQPQTIEALSHIRSAGIPMIVAINKIDKETANIDKIKSELSELGLTPEDWGGDAICVEISALQGQNIDVLLDTLTLIYEVEKENIQGNANRGAVGTIIESHVDKGAGPLATCLVQTGTLEKGDTICIGNCVSKIKSLKNWLGEDLKKAGPSTPVQISGLKTVPQVGDILEEITDKKEIKKLNKLASKQGYKLIQRQNHTISSSVGDEDEEKRETKKVNLILKADVFGSIEAILESLEKIKSDEVQVDIIKQGLGQITVDDVNEAFDLGATVIGFHAKVSPEAHKRSVHKQVEIKTFEIIYDLLDFVKDKAEEELSLETVIDMTGKIKLLKIFKKEKKEIIVGGRAVEGKISNEQKCFIYRDHEKIGKGCLNQLQTSKENVSEVVEDQECGMKIETQVELQEGDTLEFFKEEKRKQKL
jgi:translation initiation factor IF-2